jgi:hypothetical protein
MIQGMIPPLQQTMSLFSQKLCRAMRKLFKSPRRWRIAEDGEHLS